MKEEKKDSNEVGGQGEVLRASLPRVSTPYLQSAPAPFVLCDMSLPEAQFIFERLSVTQMMKHGAR